MDKRSLAVRRDIKAGNTAEVARILGQYPSLIASRDEHGTTLLHWAVDGGDLSIIELLLRRGADINAQSNDGVTALHWAAHYGGIAVIRTLLQHGADPSATTNQGQTPLHWAVLRDPLLILTDDDRPEIIKLLLAYGADSQVQASDGRTPLDFAIGQGESSKQVAALLRENIVTAVPI